MKITKGKGFNRGDLVVSLLPEHKGLLLRFTDLTPDQAPIRKIRGKDGSAVMPPRRSLSKLDCQVVYPPTRADESYQLTMDDIRSASALEILAAQAPTDADV